MSEGEFKKRIAQKLNEVFGRPWEGQGDGFTDCKDIFPIIDEARKEFPIKKSPVFTDKNIVDVLI